MVLRKQSKTLNLRKDLTYINLIMSKPLLVYQAPVAYKKWLW